MWKPDTISTPQRNKMRQMELLKKIDACKRVKRSLLPTYMEGFHQSMVLDAQIASLTKEIEELNPPPKRKLVKD